MEEKRKWLEYNEEMKNISLKEYYLNRIKQIVNEIKLNRIHAVSNQQS
ncbi:MAG: hypothetical protein ACTSQD_07180 [Promethearchaeota archaeon]